MKSQSVDFDPWACSTHGSSHILASTFWKQRIQRLSGLKQPDRLSHNTWVATTALAIIVTILPLVELAPAAPTETTTQKNSIATFSNGVSIELVGLADYDDEQQSWWQADGTPLDWKPAVTIPHPLNQASDRLGRKVCWRLQGANGKEVQMNWKTTPSYRNHSGGRGKDQAGETLRAAAIELIDQETCNLSFSMSVPSSDWHTVKSGPANQGAGLAWSMSNGKQVGISYFRPHAEGKDSIVTCSYKMSGDVRLVMIDQDEKFHTGHTDGKTGVLGFTSVQIRFRGVQPHQLASWKLQTRKHKAETIEFCNVSLHNDQKTRVTVTRK